MNDDRTLTTPRLTMEPHGLDDFGDIAAMWADPQVTRFIGGAPHSAEESWSRLLRLAGCWDLLGFGSWAVRITDNGTFIGSIGFLDAHRSGVDGFGGNPEIGWALVPAAQGQGFASEAVAAALGWGDGRFGRTVAMIDPGNTGSVAVAARCGFRYFADARYKDAPTGLWEFRYPRLSGGLTG
ncbi:GNAT family N-acetyltransferase [Sandarakinorhabdus glacialis]|nr:GNAT family N-acetyltransferase [Polymorphobacter glacialis]